MVSDGAFLRIFAILLTETAAWDRNVDTPAFTFILQSIKVSVLHLQCGRFATKPETKTRVVYESIGLLHFCRCVVGCIDYACVQKFCK